MPDNLDEEILEKKQDSPEEKVELDLDELEDIDSSTETQGEKVELDLDDAPFLQEEKEEEKTEEKNLKKKISQLKM